MSLSDEDITRIITALDRKRGGGLSPDSDFYIAPKQHYDQHQRIDRMLEAYEAAQSQFWKWLLGIVLAGGLFMSGIISKVKGLF